MPTRRGLITGLAALMAYNAIPREAEAAFASFIAKSGTGGGGYDNLANPPSIGKPGHIAANRPLIAGGGTQLTFTAPLYGGPSTSSDVQQTVNLTNTSSTINSASDGGTPSFTNSSASIGLTNTLTANLKVVFYTTGVLPSPLIAGNGYFVIATGLSTSAFQVSATQGGSPITLDTTSMSGTHTVGQLIEQFNITVGNTAAGVNVTHKFVTVRRNAITVGGGTSGQGNCVRIPNSTTNYNTIVEDNWLDGGNDTDSYNVANSFGGGTTNGLTVRRNTTGGCEKPMTPQVQQNTLLIDNYVWNCAGPDPDGTDAWFVTNSCFGILCKHNYFDGTSGGTQWDSAINCTNYPLTGSGASISNIVYQSNYHDMPNCTHCIIVDSSYGGGGNTNLITGVQLLDNGFTTNVSQVFSDIKGATNPAAQITANSGNFLMASQSATSGTLVNAGTGVLANGTNS